VTVRHVHGPPRGAFTRQRCFKDLWNGCGQLERRGTDRHEYLEIDDPVIVRHAERGVPWMRRHGPMPGQVRVHGMGGVVSRRMVVQVDVHERRNTCRTLDGNN
jgi:hypothetical protein